MYCKPFPLYEKLCEIYSKDRANGCLCKGLGDDEVDKNKVDKNENEAITSFTMANGLSSGRRDRKRRRKMENEELGGVTTTLTSLIDVEDSTLIMNHMKKSFMQDVEIVEKRTNLFGA